MMSRARRHMITEAGPLAWSRIDRTICDCSGVEVASASSKTLTPFWMVNQRTSGLST